MNGVKVYIVLKLKMYMVESEIQRDYDSFGGTEPPAGANGYDPERILSPKEIMMHYPYLREIVGCLPDGLIEMFLIPLKLMAPMYGIIYGLEHRVEGLIEPCLAGQKMSESGDWRARCMEGRYQMLIERWMMPFLQVVPGGAGMMKLFLEWHAIFLRFCPTLLLMSLVAPEEFAKAKFWSYTVDDVQLPWPFGGPSHEGTICKGETCPVIFTKSSKSGV